MAYADAKQAYLENVDWFATGDVAKARAFIVACARLMVEMPKRAGGSGNDVEFDFNSIRQQQVDAQRFVAAAGGGVVHASFEEFGR